MSTKTIVFQQTLPITTGRVVGDVSPVNGIIRQVTFHFPPGCNALVDISFSVNNKQVCPTSGFISLDSATPQFIANEPVKVGSRLSCVMTNNDGVNPHTVSVIVGIEEDEDK